MCTLGKSKIAFAVESCLRIVMAELDNGDAQEEFLQSVFVLGRKVPMHA